MSFLSTFKPVLYIRICADRLSVRDVATGAEWSDVPEVAISRTPKAAIAGVGANARVAAVSGAEIVNPFKHPRTPLGDFTVAEQLLKTVVRLVCPASLLRAAPRALIHPLGEHAGGLTQLEIRAFRELALGAGASDVVVWEGRELVDSEVLEGRFPQEGKVLA